MKVELKIFINFQILLLFFEELHGSTQMKIINLACKSFDTNWAEFKLCQLKAVKRDVTEVSMLAELHDKPLNSGTIRFAVSRRGYEHTRPLIDFKFDMCRFLRDKKKNLLAKSLYELMELDQYSNINHTCPYNHDIVINKYRFNASLGHLIPVPRGSYSVKLSWLHKQLKKADIDWAVKISDDK